ncbi:hypothetical protein F5Y17DRAFT_470024 [Xylariaceae sp. FL0594]|nr:hypothetical protein F5Y17DRAFT_470024 [Xylariaceae sp. FL0594]
MDSQPGQQEETLVSAIERHGRKAFDPTADPASRAGGQRDYASLISRTSTSALMHSLNSLIKPGRVPDWLRVHLVDVLTILPQRPGGVRATLEFIFSVHPTSTVRPSEAATPQKQGANITMEALKMATNLLSAPPSSVTPEAWFPGIAPQLLALLDGNDGPDLARVAAYVIGFGVLGRKQLGAPGAADISEVIDLRNQNALVTADALHVALRRLSSLLNSHPNPGLTKRLLSPLLVPLWSLSSWPLPNPRIKTRYSDLAQSLIDTYLKLAGSADKYLEILDNLLFDGDVASPERRWKYEEFRETGIQVRKLQSDEGPTLNLDVIESKVTAFMSLLQRTASDTDISTVFLNLFETSLGSKKPTGSIQLIQEEDTDDPISQLTQATTLQAMMQQIPDKLVSSSKQLLELVRNVLAKFGTDSANDDAVPAALSLLNLVITVPSFQRKDIPEKTLSSIENSLSKISSARNADTSQTAHNLSQLLKYRDELEDPADRPSAAPTDRQVEDRKTYNLALSYITQADSPPPVRSEGLNLLGTLIKSKSPILDIPATLVLLSSLLSDDDEYISLRVMKVFVQLAERHPLSTVREVLDNYVDSSERLNTDTRLRFGEALLQLMQRLGETFTGEMAVQVGEALLALAGRRAHRPKTEEEQRKAELAEERKRKAKERAAVAKSKSQSNAGGTGSSLTVRSPALEDEDEDENVDMGDLEEPDERERNALLARIVSGWESRRGSEDMRIRASALSLFTSALDPENNNNRSFFPFPPQLVEAALALCLDVLTLEAGEPGAGILRRAAVVFVLVFVRVLGEARDRRGGGGGSSLGFGAGVGGVGMTREEDVERVLRYVEQTDEDGLVRQHARDALDNLENLRLVRLVPNSSGVNAYETPPLVRVAGLDMTRPALPTLDSSASSFSSANERARRGRMIIEEVE